MVCTLTGSLLQSDLDNDIQVEEQFNRYED